MRTEAEIKTGNRRVIECLLAGRIAEQDAGEEGETIRISRVVLREIIPHSIGRGACRIIENPWLLAVATIRVTIELTGMAFAAWRIQFRRITVAP